MCKYCSFTFGADECVTKDISEFPIKLGDYNLGCVYTFIRAAYDRAENCYTEPALLNTMVYLNGDYEALDESVPIKYCPMCGKKLSMTVTEKNMNEAYKEGSQYAYLRYMLENIDQRDGFSEIESKILKAATEIMRDREEKYEEE